MNTTTLEESNGTPLLGRDAERVHDGLTHLWVQEVAVNALVNECHGRAVAAGWYKDPRTGEPVKRNVGEQLALIHSEVSEALEGHRKNKQDDHLPHRKSIEVELADALIRICDLAGYLELDLGGAYREKLEYNAKRADHRLENRAASGGKAF